MKRLFTPVGVGAGAIILLLANLGSYIMGMGRDIVMAHYFGGGGATDIYFMSFRIPDFLFHFLALGFISGVFLTLFAALEKKKAVQLMQSFLTILLCFVSLLSLLVFLFLPWILQLFPELTRQLSAEDYELFVEMTRLLLLTPILFTASNLIGMVLLARKRFLSMALSPMLYNLGIILGIIFLQSFFGIYAAVLGALLGAFLHLLVRIIDLLYTEIRVRPSFRFSPELKEVFTLGIHKTIALGFFQLTILAIEFQFAVQHEAGVSAWNYARNIQSLPISLFGIAFATAALPFLADYAKDKKKEAFEQRLEKSLSHILFFAIPAMVGLLFLGQEVIRLLLEHGEFDAEATKRVSLVLFFLALGIPFESATHLLSRSFLAQKNTLFPMLGKLLFFGTTALFLSFFFFGLEALGMAFALACAVEALFLALSFFLLYGFFPYRSLSVHVAKILFLTGIMALVLWGTTTLFAELALALRLGLAISLGGAVYLGLSFVIVPDIPRETFLLRKKK